MISKDTIQEVMDRMDILDVAQKLLSDLKQSGSSWKAKSPFTNEKSPSFFIVPSKQIFKCFSTGKGGGCINLVMEVRNLSYPEAIEWLCGYYNIECKLQEDTRTPDEKEKAAEQENNVRKLMSASLGQWKKAAENTPAFAEWTESRKITADDIVQWGIALAPNEWRYITPKVVDAGLLTLAIEIGLCKHKEGGNYDAYRNRIIFPIHSLKGKLIGFAGRALPSNDEAKYINPSDSFLYNKSKVLYGWHYAIDSIRKNGSVRLVEGYVDVIAMHRVGLLNTVAPCGTAITEEQARIIAKAAKQVVLTLDGDAAGLKAAKRAIPILVATGIEVKVCVLPEGKDADDFVRNEETLFPDDTEEVMHHRVHSAMEAMTFDAIQWMIKSFNLEDASPAMKSSYSKEVAELLSLMPDEMMREEYVNMVVAQMKLNKKSFKKMVDDILEKEEKKKQVERAKKQMDHTPSVLDEDEFLPDWAMPYAAEIKKNVIFQKVQGDAYWPKGIYSPPVSNNAPRFVGLEQVTNYTITPLFQIRSATDGQWIFKMETHEEEGLIQMENAALISADLFKRSLINSRGYSTHRFQKFHYDHIVKYIVDNSRKCYELTTLGHEPKKGFFAFANAAVFFEKEELQVRYFDEYGIAEILGNHYLSSGASKVMDEFVSEDNMYENDLYLKYVDSQLTFGEWAEMYCTVYDDHGAFGVAFALLSIYKDMIYKIGAKCPLLYLYGPKGSGKSAMGESLMWLFFSGLNVEGRLIQAVNMSPSMVTDFALASALQRFRNCPRLFNEYDPTLTDQKYRGWFKAVFDGEGRERGSGSSGTKRKTEIMKIQGTVMLAGQYLDTADDGAVMTRAINLRFSEEKNKNRTQEQKDMWAKLNEYERKGMSSVLIELLGIRSFVEKKLKDRFYEVKKLMTFDGMEMRGSSVEERLLNNYSLCYTFCDIVNEKVKLPFDMKAFYKDCVTRMVELSAMVSDNSLLYKFWNVIASLIDADKIKFGQELDTALRESVPIRGAGASNDTLKFPKKKMVMFIRLDQLYAAFSKEMRDRGAAPKHGEDQYQTYLKDAPYFIGLTPNYNFKQRATSAYVLDMEKMEELGIRLLVDKVTNKSEEAGAANTPNNEFSSLEDTSDF